MVNKATRQYLFALIIMIEISYKPPFPYVNRTPVVSRRSFFLIPGIGLLTYRSTNEACQLSQLLILVVTVESKVVRYCPVMLRFGKNWNLSDRLDRFEI